MPTGPAASDARPYEEQAVTRQRQKSPNRIIAEAEEQWLFTEAELLRNPSIQDGMPVEKEREARAKGLNFIRQVGIMLKLPELTLSTAAIFFNRFLMRMSLVDRPGVKALHHYVSLPPESVAMSSRSLPPPIPGAKATGAPLLVYKHV